MLSLLSLSLMQVAVILKLAAGIPEPVVARLLSAVEEAMASETVTARMPSAGADTSWVAKVISVWESVPVVAVARTTIRNSDMRTSKL